MPLWAARKALGFGDQYGYTLSVSVLRLIVAPWAERSQLVIPYPVFASGNLPKVCLEATSFVLKTAREVVGNARGY
ncbi:hypothetical protein GCM10007052_37270 [Halioglobus japonicus]|nr:hypothetical protein GCM10007052_37270 [Halioglobus japonicus]